MNGSPESSSHVDGVSGGQLELHRVDLEAEGDGVKEGLLSLLSELEDCWQDVVPLQLRCGLAAPWDRRPKVNVVALLRHGPGVGQSGAGHVGRVSVGVIAARVGRGRVDEAEAVAGTAEPQHAAVAQDGRLEHSLVVDISFGLPETVRRIEILLLVF